MIDLAVHLLDTAPGLDAAFRAAVDAGCRRPTADLAVLAAVRARHGFAERVAPLLTPPDANVKLAKGVVPSYGLTLHHFRTVLPAYDLAGVHYPRLVLNLCPNAGHCVKVCVLNNGHGRWDSTKSAWRWRTDMAARHPESFARILVWELATAVPKHGAILFRPDVNSDAAWYRTLPSLCNGYLAGVSLYGYSKRPETLANDGQMGSVYRVAYSWNERSNADTVAAFVARGGNVAVVTSRTPKTTISGDVVYPFGTYAAVDADLTDEWILAGRGSVGNLSAKGAARKLIGKSPFVVTTGRRTLSVRAA